MATRFSYFGFEYEINEDDKTVVLRRATSASGKVFIPKEVENGNKKYTVVGIGGFYEDFYCWGGGERETDGRKKNYWRVEPHWIKYDQEQVSPFTIFNDKAETLDKRIVPNMKITSVVLPDTVKKLGGYAFSRCYALEKVSLPKSITEIPFACFSYAKALKHIELHERMTSIEDMAFLGCVALKHIELHEGITSIGRGAFAGCTALTEITIPSSVKTIDEGAFDDLDMYDGRRESDSGLKVVNILNDEGAVIIHPTAFTDRTKINYLGKNGAKKVAKAEQKKDATPAKGASIDLEKLIQAALVDGIVTDKERAILVKKVKEAGGDVDEFEMLLDARIFEATKKTAKVETPKAAPKPAKTETKVETPKPTAKPVSTNGNLTVASIAEAFKSQFGAVLRIYNGRSKADGGMSLQDVGLKQEISTTFDGKQKVGDFIAQMAKVGLTVKVYTCDDWVAVLDGLTLEQAGKVKKSATKADMEKML